MKNTITDSDKLKLLHKAAETLVTQIRSLNNESALDDLDSEAHSAIMNICDWVDGVIKKEDAYMPWRSEYARKLLSSNVKVHRAGY